MLQIIIVSVEKQQNHNFLIIYNSKFKPFNLKNLIKYKYI